VNVNLEDMVRIAIVPAALFGWGRLLKVPWLEDAGLVLACGIVAVGLGRALFRSASRKNEARAAFPRLCASAFGRFWNDGGSNRSIRGLGQQLGAVIDREFELVVFERGVRVNGREVGFHALEVGIPRVRGTGSNVVRFFEQGTLLIESELSEQFLSALAMALARIGVRSAADRGAG
jgi:hypothetical protein